MTDTAMHRPQLAAPAVGKARRRQHDQPVRRAFRRSGMTGRVRSAVGAVVVDDDDVQRAGVILRQQ